MISWVKGEEFVEKSVRGHKEHKEGTKDTKEFDMSARLCVPRGTSCASCSCIPMSEHNEHNDVL